MKNISMQAFLDRTAHARDVNTDFLQTDSVTVIQFGGTTVRTVLYIANIPPCQSRVSPDQTETVREEI